MCTPTNTLKALWALTKVAQISKRVIYPDDRMKQAQSETRYRSASRWWVRESTSTHSRHRADRPLNANTEEMKPLGSWSLGQLFISMIVAVWFLITLPFRLVFWLVAWMGRLTATVLGFSFMVVGIALWAGPLFFLGIPLFLVGLFLTLRSLD